MGDKRYWERAEGVKTHGIARERERDEIRHASYKVGD